MNPRIVLIAGGVLIVAAFLLGFVPQYQKANGLESRLAAGAQELNTARSQAQMREIGLLIGRVYLDVNQKNYGTASQSATRFFDQARAAAGQETDANRKTFLQTALNSRDAVIAGLAKGDPAILGPVQDLFQKALEAAR
jgi:hypothetical protein